MDSPLDLGVGGVNPELGPHRLQHLGKPKNVNTSGYSRGEKEIDRTKPKDSELVPRTVV